MIDKQQKNSYFSQQTNSFFAGWFSGICQVIIGIPFDFVKIRVQCQQLMQKQYCSVMDIITQAIQKEGYSSFYKGVGAPLIGSGAAVSLQFGSNSFCKSYCGRDQDLSNLQLFLCGGFAGVVQSLVLIPMEHLRIKQQTCIQKSTLKLLLSEILYNHGIQGLYKGSIITILREFAGGSSYFLTYELIIRIYIKTDKDRQNIGILLPVMAGGIAGVNSWIFNYPFDIIKSTIQADSLNFPIYKNSLHVFQVFSSQGYQRFFVGLTPCLIRAFPVNATAFLAYEKANYFLNNIKNVY